MTPPVSATGGSADSSAVPAPLVRVPWVAFSAPAPDEADLGTGIIALRIDFDDSTRAFPLTDTLVFRSEPRGDAPVVGALLVERPARTTWSTAALVPKGTRLNFREYDYEQSGVPTDSIDATTRWVRGILGFTPEKSTIRGWTSLDAPRVISLAWADQVADQASFFFDAARARLYTTLAEAKAGQGGDSLPSPRFTLEEVLERNESWLRVRIRWPYEACSGDATDGTQTRDVWIRYLDERGRPLVFYRTRGC